MIDSYWATQLGYVFFFGSQRPRQEFRLHIGYETPDEEADSGGVPWTIRVGSNDGDMA